MWFNTLFPQILNMSLIAGIGTVLVLLARLPLKKAPKIFSHALWAAVLFRLLCPLSFESPVIVVPDTAVITSGQLEAVVPSMTFQTPADITINRSAEAEKTDHPVYVSSEAGGNVVITFVWLFGIAAMLVYSLFSLLRLKRRLVGAVPLRENIYLADRIATPFVIGVIRPKIYLPSTLSEREQEYITLHEQTHIRRFDHIVKIASFLVLTVHWFNPLVWVAFILFGKDMEMSCDEAVMRKMGGDIRADYSASLLRLATGRKIFTGAPLAFGEGDTRSRINNVLRYKKPAFWVIIVSFISVAALMVIVGTFIAAQASDTPTPGNPTDRIAGSPPELPFEATTDILSSFTEEDDPTFDESKEKTGLSCNGLDNSSYAHSEDTISVSSEIPQKMIFHCTWGPASKTVYIGFIDTKSQAVYVFSSVGGSLRGTVSLDKLPDGEYQVIMYGSDNKDVESATMLYQFQ